MDYRFKDLDDLIDYVTKLAGQADDIIKAGHSRRSNTYLTAVGRRGAFEDVRNMLVCFQKTEVEKAKAAHVSPPVSFRYRVEYVTAGNPSAKLQGFTGSQIFTEHEAAERSFEKIDDRHAGVVSVELWEERLLRNT